MYLLPLLILCASAIVLLVHLVHPAARTLGVGITALALLVVGIIWQLAATSGTPIHIH